MAVAVALGLAVVVLAAPVAAPGMLPQAVADYRQGLKAKALGEFLRVVAEEPDGPGRDEALRYVWEIANSVKKAESSLVLDPGGWRASVEKARRIVEGRRRETALVLGRLDRLAAELSANAPPLESLRAAGLFMGSGISIQADELSRLRAERDLAVIRQSLKVLSDKPFSDSADIHEIKGYFWLYQGDLELAVREWREALADQPRDEHGLREHLVKIEERWQREKTREQAEHELELGISDFKAGDYQHAFETISKAASLDPQNETARKYLELSKTALAGAVRQRKIQALLEKGRRDSDAGSIFDAVQDWVDILILDTSNEEARRQLQRTRARLIVSQPAPPPAVAVAASMAAPKPPTPEERLQAARQAQEAYALGLIYYNDGELEKAKGAFLRALRAQPEYEKAKRALEQVAAEINNR